MRNLKNQVGQSTIEFIFAFAFGVSVVFLMFNTAINSVAGYLVHYSTFMASRTYLVAERNIGMIGSNPPPDTSDAYAVFDQYSLNIFDIESSGFAVNEVSDGQQAGEYLTVGARTIFEKPIDPLGRVAGGGKLQYVSESFLGKEPTRSQCANRTCYGVVGGECSGTSQYDVTLYDNGC